ncbi:MAG: protein translocase subunit SecD [Dehalococcoidia bacterium]
MRRVGPRRLILILLILVVSVSSIVFQNFDVSFLGLRLQRGSDAILGLKLGLDLQGGSHLVYQARGTTELSISFREPVTVEGVHAAITGVGKTEAVVVPVGELGVSVLVKINTLREAELDAEGSVVRDSDLDIIRRALEADVAPVETLDVLDIPATPTKDQMEGVLDTIERRINPFGITEPVIQLMGENRILVQLPGLGNVEEVKRLIGQTARLEFKERTCFAEPCELPENHEDKETGLTGEDLARAYAGTHPDTGVPIVNVEFNSRGTQIFADMTTRLYNTSNRFAVFLDEDEIISPVVRQPILGGAAFIEGPDFTADRVRTISIQLESGRLPIPIEVVQEQNVNAILGAESLRKSLIAGIAGLGLVLLFMAIYYRAAGVVAALALVIYTAAVLAIFKLWPVTLTLAGVAAFILSIGMAVDANILIFERMKEELRLGRTLASAIEIGFNRAWPSIRDSNVSTLITCAILFWFGQRLGASLVSGFAATLAIGVAVSMFSSITVSKTLLNLFGVSPVGRRRSWFTPESLPSTSQATAGGVAEERE